MTDPQEGQLRGIGLRLDPKGILIAPHTIPGSGLQWGYTIIDRDRIPTMYINGEWQNVVPEGVWYQMLANWDDIAKFANDLFSDYPTYLEYPEVRKLCS
jgi:hypothetical protein